MISVPPHSVQHIRPHCQNCRNRNQYDYPVKIYLQKIRQLDK